MSKHNKHSHTQNKGSSKSRRKAFWLLIILGIIVMLVYALSFQGAEDAELIQETTPQTEQQ